MFTLRQIVAAAIQVMHKDGGYHRAAMPQKLPKEIMLEYEYDPAIYSLAEELCTQWLEDPNQIVNPDTYLDIAEGVHEYGRWAGKWKVQKKGSV